MRFALLLFLVAILPTRRLAAQTPADSAGIILSAARMLQREGHTDAARHLLQLVRNRYAATPSARVADSLLGTLPKAASVAPVGSGRTGFILFHTVYGGFLGLAIPAAFGAQGSGPYGAGLLLGAPIGYFASRAFARRKITMPGQAGIASFATAWGTWQGLALQQVFNIGTRSSSCTIDCFASSSSNDNATWAAMVIGGLAGLGTGLALASHPIPAGTSTLVSHSAFWGSWYGVSLGRVFGAEGDDLLGITMVAGDGALLLAIPAARAWRPASSQVRLATAAGIAGGLAGFGIILLAKVDDDKAGFAIPAATSAIGLIAGAIAARNRTDREEADPMALSLVTVRDGVRLRLPIPIPAAVPVEVRGLRRWRPGLRFTLLDADF